MPETNDLPQINQTGEYQSSRCLVVFGTKGGVGKTVIAANLAVCLAQRSGKPVCLLDIDVTGTGDLAKMLGLKVTHTVAGMVTKAKGRSIGQLDWPVADLVAAHPSGIHVIQCVDHPSQRQLLDAPLIHALFSSLRRRYDYIIVDAGKGFTDPLIAAFDEANLILLVATPEIISLYQTKWAMNLIESLLFPPNMVKAVLNRAESRGGVNTRDARVAMPCEFIGEIPSDGRAMVTAINQGQAVVNLYDRSKISEAFRRLAEILVTTPNLFLSHQELSRRKETPSTEEATGAAGGVHGAVRFFAHPAGATTPGQDQADEIVRMKRRIHQQLVEELDLKKVDLTLLTNENSMLEMRSRCQQVVANLLSREMGGLISSREVRTRLVEEILDEALGLGPLEELLDDSSISDILVNNKDQIYVERSGKLELTRKKFLSDDQVRAVMERIVAPLGRRIDESSPMVDARLPDGSRVNAIIPPLSVHGPVLSIRKFTGVRFTQDDLVRLGTLTPSMAQFIRACVLARKNLIISGGTGSGKTTLLNIVSAFIPENERIITIEDAAELRLNQEHWVSLEARPSNVEGRGQITIRDLFRNALRMRPDRIMIGECRGAETLDMLQAMNTGHDGSFTTLHANSPRDVVNRLDSLVLMSNIEL
ncbi:MAG: Flp pilus assembly complex ATPase component TadA, partial [Candidatus Omnitrophica bacterium]|nr:Flp pilus assembly complex ATPase component TadA [Candidatus Omnitrophota bacterium]